jgi:hypothetical protein
VGRLGAQPDPNAALSPEELAFFDRIALLTADPDANLDVSLHCGLAIYGNIGAVDRVDFT